MKSFKGFGLALVVSILLVGSIYLLKQLQNTPDLSENTPPSQDIANTTGNNVAPEKPIITLLYPNGAETLKAGSSYTIKWNTNNAFKKGYPKLLLSLHDSKGSGIPEPDARPGVAAALAGTNVRIDNTGSYVFNIPASVPAGAYKFRIEGIPQNTMQSGPSDYNDSLFVITNDNGPVVIGNLEKGGENWEVNSFILKFTDKSNCFYITQFYERTVLSCTHADNAKWGVGDRIKVYGKIGTKDIEVNTMEVVSSL